MRGLLFSLTTIAFLSSQATGAQSTSSLKESLQLFEELNSPSGPLSGQATCPQQDAPTQNCQREAINHFIGWCKGISTKPNASTLTLTEIKTELNGLIQNQKNSDCLKKAMSSKSDQMAFYIQQRGQVSQRKSCSEYASTKTDLKSEVLSDAVWGQALEKVHAEEIKTFRKEQIYPKDFKKFEFIACAHTATFSNKDEMISTNKKLLSHLETKGPAVIEVERSDKELNCEVAATTLFKSEEEILQRGEHEVAIWYALQNQKILRGGEPEEEDFLKMLPMISNSTIADYYNYKTHRCLSQLDMSERSKYPTWELAYAHCQLDLPEEYKSKDDQAYREWFKNKTLLKPSAFRRVDCKEVYKDNQTLADACLKRENLAKDPKDLYQDPDFELLSTPVDGADEGSMAYYASSLGHIKNFCLRKNLREASKQGTTSVIYGGGHLFENYSLLEEIAK